MTGTDSLFFGGEGDWFTSRGFAASTDDLGVGLLEGIAKGSLFDKLLLPISIEGLSEEIGDMFDSEIESERIGRYDFPCRDLDGLLSVET